MPGNDAADVAGATEDLNRLAGIADRSLTGKQLGHRAGSAGVLSGVEQLGARVEQQASSAQVVGRHIGQRERDRLEGADRLLELAASLRVLSGSVQSRVRNPVCQSTDAEAALLQNGHDRREAGAFGPEHRVGRQPDIGEDEPADLGCAQPILCSW